MPPLPFRGAILATVLALIAPEEAEDRRRRLTRLVGRPPAPHAGEGGYHKTRIAVQGEGRYRGPLPGNRR